MTKREEIPGFRESEALNSKNSWMLQNLSPYVRQSGNPWRSRWRIGSRKLLDYLLVFIDSGEGCFTLDGKAFPVGSGDTVWIPPDTSHSMRCTSAKMHCIYIHFDLIYDPERSHWDACIPQGTFDLSAFEKFMHPAIDDVFWTNLKGKLQLLNPDAVKALMVRICSLHTNCKADNALLTSGIMFELLDELKE